MKRLCSLIFLLFYIADLFSQIRTDVPKSELDSLISIIPDFRDEELVDHLNLIATSISQRHPDSCLYYAQSALKLAKSLKYDFGEAEAVFNIGNGYFYKVDIKNAMINYLLALNYYENNEPCAEHGNLLMQMGSINRHLENDIKAIELFRKAWFIFNKIGNKTSAMVTQYKIGYSFIRSEYFDSAFIYLHQALKEGKQIGHPKHLAIIYDFIGITYEWRDDLIPEKDRNGGRKAIPYLDTCFYYARLSGFQLYEEISLSNIGECYHHYINPPDHKKAEEYYLKALSVAMPDYSSYNNRGSTLAWLGELYADIGDYNKAEYYLKMALDELNRFSHEKVDNVVQFQYDRIYTDLNYAWWSKYFAYTGYMELYQYSGDYEKARLYSEFRHKALDSMNQMNTRNLIDYMMATSENERTTQKFKVLYQQKELERNKAQRSLYFIVGLGLLLVIAILIASMYIRQNRIKAQQEKTILQQKLLRSQMNPHFIFNSLASIQNSIINEEPKKASKYLAKFSRLVRNILDSSVEEFITLEQEISTIENYLALQKIRFPEKFDYTLEVDDRLDPASVRIPPMLAQPFIENAIEHGIKHKDSKGKIDVRFKLQNEALKLEVEDDGIGRQRAQEILREQDQGHKSMATAITMERIRVLNKKLKHKITMEIIDLKDEQGAARGTRVVFGLPK